MIQVAAVVRSWDKIRYWGVWDSEAGRKDMAFGEHATVAAGVNGDMCSQNPPSQRPVKGH